MKLECRKEVDVRTFMRLSSFNSEWYTDMNHLIVGGCVYKSRREWARFVNCNNAKYFCKYDQDQWHAFLHDVDIIYDLIDEVLD